MKTGPKIGSAYVVLVAIPRTDDVTIFVGQYWGAPPIPAVFEPLAPFLRFRLAVAHRLLGKAGELHAFRLRNIVAIERADQLESPAYRASVLRRHERMLSHYRPTP